MMNNKKRITIKDIANSAGVSITTVSRVLNEPESVKSDTRAKVLEIMQDVDYKPNPAAKALGSSRSNFIALVVPNLRNAALVSIIEGVMEELHTNGYEVLLYDFNADARMEKQTIEHLNEIIIDGAILFPSLATDEEIRKISTQVPLVVIEREVESHNLDCMLVDELSGMRALVKHLKSFGHKNIGMITGKRGTSTAKRRAEYFRTVMLSNGLEFKEQNIIDTSWSLNGGVEGIHELINRDRYITAMICSSDHIALGALGAAYQMGIRVPQDISIVGFDNSNEGEYAVPPLTTLYHPATQIGTLAARYLLERIENPGKRPESRILPQSLISRQSVSVPRKEGELIIE
jgi:LacI family transcriptional regulator